MSKYKIDDTLSFDCYIQRFNDFVVIIAEGTRLTQKDLHLLEKTDKHYIKFSDYERVFGIELAKEEKEEETLFLSCQELQKLSAKTDEQKVAIIYHSLITYMQKYFLREEEFSRECLNKYLYELIMILHRDIHLFKSILVAMSHVNRHEVHSTNVAMLAIGLGVFLEYPIPQVKKLAKAAILHDLGKGDIDEHIFHKRAKLNKEEFSEMQKHSYYGYLDAQNLGIDDKDILTAILHHHEYLDGSGYPDGLRAQKITPFTQILTICDMFDAMTSTRDFRDKKTAMESLMIMKKEYKGKLRVQYIDEFLRLIAKVSSS